MSSSDKKAATKKVFGDLQSKSENKICSDCSANNPQWASVSHGTFICIKCAGTHRSMGVHISFVRSITMDSWSLSQLEKMKVGGNQRLQEFLTRQKFPSGLSLLQKYDNEACSMYREMITAKSKGESPSRIPFIGFKETQHVSKSQSPYRSHSPSPGKPRGSKSEGRNFRGRDEYTPPRAPPAQNHRPPRRGEQKDIATEMWGSISGAFSSVAESSKRGFAALSDKSKDSDLGHKIQQGASKGWGAMSDFFTSAADHAQTLISGEERPVHFYRPDQDIHHNEKYTGFGSENRKTPKSKPKKVEKPNVDDFFNEEKEPKNGSKKDEWDFGFDVESSEKRNSVENLDVSKSKTEEQHEDDDWGWDD